VNGPRTPEATYKNAVPGDPRNRAVIGVLFVGDPGVCAASNADVLKWRNRAQGYWLRPLVGWAHPRRSSESAIIPSEVSWPTFG
jgi:hypothetical protein